jgi:hypothetical protein
MFMHDLNWHKDDLTLASIPRKRGVLQIAMYAEHLSTGSTLMCHQIHIDTLKAYIRNVASFFGLFGSVSRDFRKDNDIDTRWSRHLQGVFDEHSRWADMPDRREAYTLEMLASQEKRASAPGISWLSLEAAWANWAKGGMFGGNRCSEYAQSGSNSDPKKPAKNIRGDTQAYTLPDMEVQTYSGRFLKGADILSVPWEEIETWWSTLRTQKNGDNGQRCMWQNTKNKLDRNYIQPMYTNVKRFVHLMGPLDTTTPLSVYQTKSGQIRLLTARDIEKEMQATAAAVYNLCPKKDKAKLKKWTSHSIRVGACVLLHSQGATETQLQHLLRWKSNAFMAYLRSSPLLCAMQNACFANTKVMPNFL